MDHEFSQGQLSKKKYLIHVPHFSFFLIYSSTYKNYNSVYKILIDVILFI